MKPVPISPLRAFTYAFIVLPRKTTRHGAPRRYVMIIE